ncbi:MAG: DNA adenine methylase [Spirochaetaceae bacterium]|nr:DNA adenine methylase [Spirochaetaceae bacterium]MDT8297552.1 DNA adenine methylase [Spirochaetaceae bacterium]
MGRIEDDPYLTRGVIAYLGNKRRLLGLIGEALGMSVGHSQAGLGFADLFSGSGVVSRYARLLGMSVVANDWEPYAGVLARAWLEPTPKDITRIFGSPDGLERAISKLDDLVSPSPDEEYLARYYAPASDDPDQADYRTERLFYTRSNALKLDAARNHLEQAEEHHGADPDAALRLSLLLAPLIYAAATHVNTSGVFKAYHKGFGGHGKDALGRIMSPISFQAPLVRDKPPGRVYSTDALELAGSGALDNIDVVYLDPPYNQHQYGSNYHLLNTLVHWDRLPEPLLLGSDGRLKRKAGIRSDWKKTKSDYCYTKSAETAFSNLMDSLSNPVVLLSYSTDGIIPFEALRRRCEAYGRVRLSAHPYVTYRGGRQSVGRQDQNLEFVMIVEKGSTTRRRDRSEADNLLNARRLQLLKKAVYRPDILKESGKTDGPDWIPSIPGKEIRIRTRHFVRLENLPELSDLLPRETEMLVNLLTEARCRSRAEEVDVLLDLWKTAPNDSRDMVKEIPRIMRKMAHRKYQDQFEERLSSIRELGRSYPKNYMLISKKIDDIEELAGTRFSG